MLHIQCNGCGSSAFVECGCPPGWDIATLGHLGSAFAAQASQASGRMIPPCPFAELGSNVTCPPNSGCCQEAHSHDGNANACEGNHQSACVVPDNCRVHIGAGNEGSCPGGHCAKGVSGCTVCRPVTIQVIPGSTQVQLAGPSEPPVAVGASAIQGG